MEKLTEKTGRYINETQSGFMSEREINVIYRKYCQKERFALRIYADLEDLYFAYSNLEIAFERVLRDVFDEKETRRRRVFSWVFFSQSIGVL